MNILHLPFDVLRLIFNFTDGLVRSKCEGVCSIFYKIASNIVIKTDYPERDREVKLINLCQKSYNNLCFYGHIDLLVYYPDNIGWFGGLGHACRGGRIDIVKLMIKHGTNDLNIGMVCACRNGYINIVKLMIKYGANYWNDGMRYACDIGNIDIVKLMMDHGANDWNVGIIYACRAGCIDIVKLMIENGATKKYINYCLVMVGRSDTTSGTKYPKMYELLEEYK